MKTFAWDDLLRHHPIFSKIDHKRVQWLLDDEVSLERLYPAGTTILREGEVGDSVFVIGSGLVDVTLSGGEGKKASVAALRRGEIFGEMAFFEHRPRSATLVATEASTVLEIKGPKFSALIDEYPDIEFKVLLKMSERLRSADALILATQMSNVDDKLRRFEERQDVQQKVVDASMKSAMAIFDHTKLRSDEIINAADRSRAKIAAAATVIGGFATIVITMLGLFGFKEMWNLSQAVSQVQKQSEEAKKYSDEAENSSNRLRGIEREWKRSVLDRLYLPQFKEALRGNSPGDAADLFERVQKVDEAGETLSLLLAYIEEDLVLAAKPVQGDGAVKVSNFVKVLQSIAGGIDEKKAKEKAKAYYVLLAYAALTRATEFDSKETLEAMRQHVSKHKASTFDGLISDAAKKRFDEEKDTGKRRELQRIADVAAGRSATR
jgi:CRP-like cAMP-binding protein